MKISREDLLEMFLVLCLGVAIVFVIVEMAIDEFSR